ncbi:unnamed protein product [Prorocentrum cordatum]|uniref:Uncharacterized protein n=1 Tax=Prorocentrum cordatum TaxID=2364126 RepID=A0ABN9XGT0_9DINO|nr:unnamed protein product [Polarella glacialis]
MHMARPGLSIGRGLPLQASHDNWTVTIQDALVRRRRQPRVLAHSSLTMRSDDWGALNQSALRQRQGLRAARAAAPPPRAEDPGRRDWEKAHQCGARVAALSAAPVRPGSSSTPVLCRATSGGHLVVGVVVCP